MVIQTATGSPSGRPLIEPVEPGVVGVTVAEVGGWVVPSELNRAVVRATYSRPRAR